MHRRRALQQMAAGGLGAAAATLWVDALRALASEQAEAAHALMFAVNQTATAWAGQVFNPHQQETVATLAELIIPATDTPGARAVLVDRFIDTVLGAAAPADRSRFLAGLAWLDRRSTSLFGTTFVSATVEQQTTLLTRLSADTARASDDRVGAEFFTAIKAMTISGYYTSEIGLRQELGDDGRLMLATFEGCTHPEHQR